jgi:hypothetical protein
MMLRHLGHRWVSMAGTFFHKKMIQSSRPQTAPYQSQGGIKYTCSLHYMKPNQKQAINAFHLDQTFLTTKKVKEYGAALRLLRMTWKFSTNLVWRRNFILLCGWTITSYSGLSLTDTQKYEVLSHALKKYKFNITL